MLPHSGDILRITRAASPQFASVEPFLFRVIRVHDWPTYDGWCNLDGYQLDLAGREAVERRSLFLLIDGLQQVTELRSPRARQPRRQPARRTAKAVTTDACVH